MTRNKITEEQVAAARGLIDAPDHLSIRQAALRLGINEASLRYHLNGRSRHSKNPPTKAPRAKPEGIPEPGVDLTDDGADITSPPGPAKEIPTEASLMRKHGFDPEVWESTNAQIRTWEGSNGEGGVQEYAYLRLSLRKRIDLALLIPATHVPELAKPPRTASSKRAQPILVTIEADNQAPYFDPKLDAATNIFHAEHQPDIQIFAGDLIDLPTISRFTDHPAALSTVQEGLDAGYHVLRRRREAAPHAKALKLKGNHDWRLEQEILRRAERLHAITPVGEDVPALSLRRLLQLDALEIEFVENALGWEHGEIELVPGRDGLVVRHGFITGKNTAGRTLDKLGRSAIVFHNHDKEHVWRLDYPEKVLREAVVGGTMSRNDEVFPHFAQNADWHQGYVTATIWPDGRYQLEHAIWRDGELFWRDERIKP